MADLQCSIERVLDSQTYTKHDGSEITKHGFIGKTLGQYPKLVKFDVIGEKAGQIMSCIQVGNVVDVSYNPVSREWQGKWFTELQVWRTSIVRSGAMQSPALQPSPIPTSIEGDNNDSDVPF